MYRTESKLGVVARRRGWFVTTSGAVMVAALLAAFVAVGPGAATASARHHTAHRPHGLVQKSNGANTDPSYPVKAFSQEFSTNTEYFCPAGSGNAPCDGNEPNGDYGTIDRVAGGFSNGGYGNYAPSTPALDTSSHGGGYMAIVSGDEDENQGLGCPESSVTEYCTGPYALFGTGAAKGAENVFPTGGFTVTNDLYLSPTTVGPAGSLVDDDVELNTSAGGYGIDNVITACAEPTGGDSMGFVINFGHNSPGSCSGSPVVTTDGWYRFVFVFTDNDGYAYLTMSVYSEGSGVPMVATSTPQAVGGGSPVSVHDWGGPGYFWLPTEDMSGLPLANFDVQLGVHTKGKAA